MQTSQIQANQVLRVLQGAKLKYTLRIQCKDGRVLEMQVPTCPKMDYNTEARELWLQGYAGKDQYNGPYPIMPASQIEFIQCEENPV